MLATTARDIAEIVGGELIGGATGTERVTGTARIDSRGVREGDLFVAFLGEHTDGHRFVSAARDAGAAISLVSAPGADPAVLVDDVQQALSALAHAQLERARTLTPELKVVAITGSAGKTGTKDLLGALLSDLGPTIAPAGNHNNEIGLPLTVLELDADTRFLVLEMGAKKIGHIAHLTQIARPDVSLVLNVGSAHLGEFGSVDAIARAKGEIVEALPADGRAILNADDARVAAMADRTAAAVTRWGLGGGDVRVLDVQLDEQARAVLTLRVGPGLRRLDGSTVPEGTREIRLRLLGQHQALNAVAAASAALVLGADLDAVTRVLEAAEPRSPQRMQALHAPGDVLVINDAYNANPESMRQALTTLAQLGRTRRTIAVLGQMLELGQDSLRMHDELGRLAVRLNVSHLFVVGREAEAIHRGACLEGSFGGESELIEDIDEVVPRLLAYVRPGDVVLLKSSRDAGLRDLAQPLVDGLTAGTHPTTGPVGMADSGPDGHHEGTDDDAEGGQA
jgi:UDP-N-acetylmuramoyl-tripeptide--D-alanyl-D-alanine ligase